MSAKYEDAMGDMLKAHEGRETERRVAPGECAMIRLDGMSFSKFTGSMKKPYDTVMADAMRATALRALETFGPNFVYTQSDEITMVFSPERIPFDGRLQKMAGGYAGKISSFFVFEAMRRFQSGLNDLVAATSPVEMADAIAAFTNFFERMARSAPSFDGRAIGVDHEMAAQFVIWREVDARRNAALGAGRAEFTQSQLGGKSPGDIKDMLTALGIDYYDKYPNQFRRGIFMRKREVAMSLTEEELARIPDHVRESKRGTTFLRSKAVEVEERGPFYEMDNIVEVLFEDADPAVVEKPFARHIVP
jgi:tRNA(His) 5'-end guanylyltransferase